MKSADSQHRTPVQRAPAPKDIDEYLESVPEPARTTLNKIRAVIRSAAPPEATETISYRIPAFKYKGMLLCFAAFSDHCSLFPGADIMETFKDELKGYRTSKGTIQFPPEKPLPAMLLKKIVKARVAANDKKNTSPAAVESERRHSRRLGKAINRLPHA
jgi:uncharacterized protein YdhG (YjbR/CyaY superfamily)